MRIPKVKFKVNLDELFGANLSYGPATRQAIGQAVIDQIVKRTQEDRKDKNGKPLKGYSKTYAQTLEAKIAGKSPGEPADLTLHGDMLGSLTIIDETSKTITIGFDDSKENAKAYGHISGMEGHPTIKKGKVRDFLGLMPSEKKQIARAFADDVEAVSDVKRSKTRQTFEEKILQAIQNTEDEIG